ncbi:MAG: TSUP family transporter, partial [Candidatus Binatia bacterium]
MSIGFTLLVVSAVGVFAGAVAAIAGFGIGSLLTPLLALQTGTKLAVAAVSIPHAIGTSLRLWMMREHVDRRVLLNFGVMSAAGGLAGALLHQFVQGAILTAVFASLLIFAGLAGLSGLAERMRFSGFLAWTAGGLSGFLGGLVGNQGGIRSAAMLGLDVPKDAFVATATAIALIVDVARVRVYL